MLKQPTFGLAPGLILLFSLVIPWTVVWGTNTTSYSSYDFQVYEFPFMAYYLIFISGSSEAWWEAYQFAPRYLGTTLIIIGGVMAVTSGLKERRKKLLDWGGILSIFALIFFTGCDSANIYIQNAPLVQNYTVVPLGMFIPALFWVMVLLQPRMETINRSISEVFCGHCGKEVSTEFDICPFCGVKLRKPVCSRCGREVSMEHRFCPYCGLRLT